VPGSSSGGSAGGTTSSKAAAAPPQAGSCERCGYISSQVRVCIQHSQYAVSIMCMHQCLMLLIERYHFRALQLCMWVWASHADLAVTAPTCLPACSPYPQPVCKACLLLEGLNRGLPRLGVSRTRRAPKAAPAAAATAAAAEPPSSSCIREQGSASTDPCGSGALCCASVAGGVCGSGCGSQQQEASSSVAADGVSPAQAAPADQGGGGSHSYLLNKGAIAAHPSARQQA
jgi:hypothetical protein